MRIVYGFHSFLAISKRMPIPKITMPMTMKMLENMPASPVGGLVAVR